MAKDVWFSARRTGVRIPYALPWRVRHRVSHQPFKLAKRVRVPYTLLIPGRNQWWFAWLLPRKRQVRSLSPELHGALAERPKREIATLDSPVRLRGAPLGVHRTT